MNSSDSGDKDLESELWLDRLEKLANEKAASSQDVSDLERAASAAALIASARMSREDLKHHSYHVRLNDAKAWAVLATPFLIFLGLLVFLPRPNQQASAMREASADSQFREVEKNFLTQVTQTGALARPDLLLLTAPLQPYLSDPRYQKETGDLSILALSHVSSPDAFQDYFVSRNIRVDVHNLPTVLTLDRMLYTNFNELDDALNSDATANVSTIVGRPSSKDQGQRARDGVLLELTFLSAKIAAQLRGFNSDPLNADLRRVYFKGVDLGNVVFGKTNLEGCQWEGVSLKNADLSGVVEFDNSQWIDANWWDARSISKPLLSYLIGNQYPYHPPVVDYANAPISRDVYQQKVMKLCGSAGLKCDAASMPYGAPAKGDKKGKTIASPA
jgi:hypothetical protein